MSKIEIVIRTEDSYKNKIYVIRENGAWRFYGKDMTLMSISNYANNAAELYIALSNAETKEDAITALATYSNLRG